MLWLLKYAFDDDLLLSTLILRCHLGSTSTSWTVASRVVPPVAPVPVSAAVRDRDDDARYRQRSRIEHRVSSSSAIVHAFPFEDPETALGHG